ncbi:uroporphyrinogen-III synthase [Rhizobium halophilum]|uniref:uroporphyrinogen-III synthase n=1 Tax=Rhizobium halophilum TaxID=2846852 RepID=UPI001EFDF2B9|nr:uroporphyrinogen-III synthase [Rhizobium halophilum]MCF6368856.1 uroporphyrinogen-III synthase [Rhizobium halophilum]
MRVLVTRPQPASQHTAGRLSALGHAPVQLPLTQAEHHPDEVLEGLRLPHAAIAITSAEAVRVLQSLGTRIHAYLSEPVFAVGDATATAAREAGFTSVEAADGTAVSMIALFGDRLRQLTTDLPVVYIAGRPRSSTFEDGLAKLCIPAVTVEGYRMEPIAVDQATLSATLGQQPVDVVLFHSRATADCFFALPLQERELDVLSRARILCLSPNVAQAVPVSLRGRVAIAEHPDEDSLFALL